jgi:hypothetical protein
MTYYLTRYFKDEQIHAMDIWSIGAYGRLKHFKRIHGPQEVLALDYRGTIGYVTIENSIVDYSEDLNELIGNASLLLL